MTLLDKWYGKVDAALMKQVAVVAMFIDHATLSFLEVARNEEGVRIMNTFAAGKALDEIGRGTSTFDGLSIAWAVVEYLVDRQKIGAKTLFATHYHELSELEGRLQGVVNYRVSVLEHGEDIVFLRKVERGGTDKSFGIHVARLAGLPRQVIMRAHEILARLETNDEYHNNLGQDILDDGRNQQPKQVNLFETPALQLVQEIQNLDVLSLTPIEALNLLFTYKEKARRA